MVDRELDSIDFRDDDAHRRHVDEAPSPVSRTPSHYAAPAEVFVVLPRPRGPRKNHERPDSEPKRSCVRITIQQRKNLLVAFREHANDMPPVLFEAKLCITISSVENLLVKLLRGEDIQPKGYYNQKSRVDPFQYLVRLKAKLDQTVPMRVVRNDLEVVVERHCGDVQSLGREVVDEEVWLRS